jgi:hypothetical protein
MKRDRRSVLATLVLGVLLLVPACREVSTESSTESEPYTLEPIEGTDISRVILTADGAERIGLETVAVTGRTVPASAIWIDVDGQEWVYTSPEPLTFVREAVTVDRYEGDVAHLSDGPAVGTEVVTVGVAELIGSEFGI